MTRALRPRGIILRETIGYNGETARPGCELRFTVSGRGQFPDDMLRYDSATALAPAEMEGRDRREVRIVHAGRVTPERWRSFGWTVHEDIEETRVPLDRIVYECEACGASHRNEFSRTCAACDRERESGDLNLED